MAFPQRSSVSSFLFVSGNNGKEVEGKDVYIHSIVKEKRKEENFVCCRSRTTGKKIFVEGETETDQSSWFPSSFSNLSLCMRNQ
jgi:hypothetical protein